MPEPLDPVPPLFTGYPQYFFPDDTPLFKLTELSLGRKQQELIPGHCWLLMDRQQGVVHFAVLQRETGFDDTYVSSLWTGFGKQDIRFSWFGPAFDGLIHYLRLDYLHVATEALRAEFPVAG